jgi:hypothetical protein
VIEYEGTGIRLAIAPKNLFINKRNLIFAHKFKKNKNQIGI